MTICLSRTETANPLVQGLLSNAFNSPDSIAIIDCTTGVSTSTDTFLTNCWQVAHQLKSMGVTAGDHLVITMPTSAMFCSIAYGAMLIGAVPVLLDSSMEPISLSKCLEELDPKMWVSIETQTGFKAIKPETLSAMGSIDNIRDYRRADANDACILIYTTGTTGLPKGVPWSCAVLDSHLKAQSSSYADFGIKSEFVLFPHLALCAIASGRKCIIPSLSSSQPNFASMQAATAQMDEHGGDYVFASPAFWRRFTNYCIDHRTVMRNVRVAATAGAAVNSKMLQELAEVLPGASIFIPYASTEVLMPIANIEWRELRKLSLTDTAMGRGIPLGRPASESDT